MPLLTDRRIIQAVIVIFTMMVFGYFAGSRLLAFSALTAAGIIMVMAAAEQGDALRLLGLSLRGRHPFMWILAGLATSVFLSLICRRFFSGSLLPSFLYPAAITATLTGMTEELLYRGFIQGILSHRHPVTGILAASAGHTAYKAILLANSPVAGMINLTNLIVLTFITGCLFGYFRHKSKQIYSPLIAHGLFDLIVYGDQSVLPPWVWY